ncbi:uncharacterized protein [Zea mays]|jgi:hypothetical protein|uniref:uncharacterized protein n=1 Tax=Zea mays TaxID=4577 RepID=UPI0009A9DEDD|nr:uncharacterized protein LOC103648631 [Zea mays]|eukprot:XP_008671287.2 uncharacterized protein LOC103648631 [Zea mays]
MGDSVDWNEDNTALVCELFAEQVKAHNRSGTHLNKTGYKNVMDKFKEKTGLSYTKMQFKNKWDKMRIEYTNWKRLSKETGIAKFKDGPLLHEEEKAIMYEDIRNTGDDHWAPSSGITPQILEGETTENTDDKDGDYEANDDKDEDYEECEEVSPTTAKGKCHVSVGRKDKGKKPKSLGGHWVQDQLSKLVTASEKSTTSIESLARKEDNGCSIRDVMALAKECGAVLGTKEHFIASQVFVKRAEREMFMTLDTPKERFNWLTMKHDWVTRMSH